jgi:hypothetical protein
VRLIFGILKILYTLRSSRGENFFCQIKLAGKLKIRIYERPGLSLTEKEQQAMVNDLKIVASDFHKGSEIPDYGVFSGVEDLRNRIITIAYVGTRPIGFAAQKFLDVKMKDGNLTVVHLGLVYVSPHFQKRSLSSLLYVLPILVLVLKYGFRSLWVSNVSQVPAIIGVVSKHFSNVYPDPINDNSQTTFHRELSAAIFEQHKKAFGVGDDAVLDLDEQIIKNAYTGGSDQLKKRFEDCAQSRDTSVNEFCRKKLNYERGDDFLQLGIMSHRVLHSVILERIPERSRIRKGLYLKFASMLRKRMPLIRSLSKNKL